MMLLDVSRADSKDQTRHKENPRIELKFDPRIPDQEGNTKRFFLRQRETEKRQTNRSETETTERPSVREETDSVKLIFREAGK
jgi:hypothetical protein